MWNRLPLVPRRLLTVALFLTLLPLLGLAQLEVKTQYLRKRQILPAQTYDLPPAPVLRALAFGYNEVGADLLWIRAIAYYADHLTTDSDLRYLERHLHNIIALDRHARHVYRYGAAMLVTQTRKTNQQVLAAIDLMRQASQLYPDDWHFPLYIGSYYISELRSRDQRQRRRWRLEGARWINRAALVGAQVPWLPSLAANIYTEQGMRDVAIRHLQELYYAAQDEEMKAQITAKLKHLKAQRTVDELKNTQQQLRALHDNSPIPFVSDDLFLLVGLPPLSPFSLRRLASPPPPSPLR